MDQRPNENCDIDNYYYPYERREIPLEILLQIKEAIKDVIV